MMSRILEVIVLTFGVLPFPHPITLLSIQAPLQFGKPLDGPAARLRPLSGVSRRDIAGVHCAALGQIP